MSLLTLIQGACRLLTLPVPTTVTGSSDANVQLLFELANEEGQEEQQRFAWQVLTKEFTFPTSNVAVQANALPSDFDRFIGNSQFDRTTRRQVLGPVTPQLWQAIQAQPQLNRVFLAFRRRGGQLLITPTPPTADTFAYEYVSANWCQSAGNAAQSAFKADTDTALLDENIMKLGLRWRFKKEKGLDYGEDFSTYESRLDIAMAKDPGAGSINFTGRSMYPNPLNNLPEGNFPSS